MPTPTPASVEAGIPITSREFAWVQEFLRRHTGIELKDGKQPLVVGRLTRRLRHHGETSFSGYFRRLHGEAEEETRIALDLLTTNETYFFREEAHFRLLEEVAASAARERDARPFRVWSAACSSGGEAYSIAMVLADAFGGVAGTPATREWEVVASDISTRVLERAARGLYPIEAAEKIPRKALQQYCLRGRDEYDGYLAVAPALARRVRFARVNLVQPLPSLGAFDVVFLRNVMIYFGLDTKRTVVGNVSRLLRGPHGHLFVSHSETLNGLGCELRLLRPSVYRLAVDEPAPERLPAAAAARA